jgi:hypothetical protein
MPRTSRQAEHGTLRQKRRFDLLRQEVTAPLARS